MVLVLVVLILMVLFHSCPFNGDRRKTPPYINAQKGQKCALRDQVQSHARERTFFAAVIVQFVTTNNGAHMNKSSSTLNRPLHILDIDNLLGDPTATDTHVINDCLGQYRSHTGYQKGDHVVVGTGCNALHVYAVQSCWPAVQYVRRSGPDGADFALIEQALIALERGRYSHFILGSGDGGFADLYDEMTARGYPVFVASRPSALSWKLRQRAGENLIYLPENIGPLGMV
jgi:hypothetical protein